MGPFPFPVPPQVRGFCRHQTGISKRVILPSVLLEIKHQPYSGFRVLVQHLFDLDYTLPGASKSGSAASFDGIDFSLVNAWIDVVMKEGADEVETAHSPLLSDPYAESGKQAEGGSEVIFYNLHNLLSTHQYRLLSAVALEDHLREPTGQAFLKKYDLGNASTVRKSLQALVD